MDWNPVTVDELVQLVAENFRGPKLPLVPMGGGTTARLRRPMSGETRRVKTAGLHRVIDYPARDMTITVEAGLRVAELQNILRAEHQQLPVDIAQPGEATIGGAIAANTFGPGCYGYGTLRDYLIGVSAIDGQGRLFSAGGRVVKNVAGYDLCKLLIGSQGTLGIITQVTLKLSPLPDARAFVCVPVSIHEAESLLAALNLSATRPTVLEVLNAACAKELPLTGQVGLRDQQFLLCIGYAASTDSLHWQVGQLLQELRTQKSPQPTLLQQAEAERFWSVLTEAAGNFLSPVTFVVHVLPSRVIEFLARATDAGCTAQVHAGNGVVEVGLPQSCTSAAEAAGVIRPLRTFAEDCGGTLTLRSCPPAWEGEIGVFSPFGTSARLMRGIKEALDPAGVLNPDVFGDWQGSPSRPNVPAVL